MLDNQDSRHLYKLYISDMVPIRASILGLINLILKHSVYEQGVSRYLIPLHRNKTQDTPFPLTSIYGDATLYATPAVNPPD